MTNLADALACITTKNTQDEKQEPACLTPLYALFSDLALKTDGTSDTNGSQAPQQQPLDSNNMEHHTMTSCKKCSNSSRKRALRKKAQEKRARKRKRNEAKAEICGFSCKQAKVLIKEARKKAKAKRSNKVECKRRRKKEMASIRQSLASLKC